MIQDPVEIRKLREENEYNHKNPPGRPKGITKEKMNLNPTSKLGRPNTTQYDIFDPHKRMFKIKTDKTKGQHINRAVRYEIEHNNTKYLFSTLSQIETEFKLSTNIVGRLIEAHDKKNNNKELSLSDQRIIEAYPKFKRCVKLPLDKNKRINGVVRYDSKLNMDDLSKLKLKIDVPEK